MDTYDGMREVYNAHLFIDEQQESDRLQSLQKFDEPPQTGAADAAIETGAIAAGLATTTQNTNWIVWVVMVLIIIFFLIVIQKTRCRCTKAQKH